MYGFKIKDLEWKNIRCNRDVKTWVATTWHGQYESTLIMTDQCSMEIDKYRAKGCKYYTQLFYISPQAHHEEKVFKLLKKVTTFIGVKMEERDCENCDW